MNDGWRHLEINKGRVIGNADHCLELNPVAKGYADAQLDDYGGKRRSDYNWMPGTVMTIEARFSHNEEELVGTAGFGFWNAPFGDPSIRLPAFPMATWFFFASPPSDLPFPLNLPGRGWFAASLNVTALRGLTALPFMFPAILLNRSLTLKKFIWPKIRHWFGISHFPIEIDMTEWHTYRLEWRAKNCVYWIDNNLVGVSDKSPVGPLGFVCWIDNQYLIATPRGNFSWGTLSINNKQWLEVQDLKLGRL